MTRNKEEQKAALTVGGQIQRSARTPFMVASEVVLHIPTDPNDRHVYPIAGGKTQGGAQLFGLARAALDDIKDAAGILILESGPVPGSKIEPDCVSWQVKGRRDQIDGFEQIELASYTLDLRLPRSFDPDLEFQHDGGGRYHEFYAGYYEKIIDNARKAKKLPWQGGDAKFKQQAAIEKEMGEEWVGEQRMAAHSQAVRAVMRMRPHITRRAETGAIHALVRNMLGVKHAYTIAELKQGIRLIRAQQNREALKMLPEDIRIKLLTAEAAAALGLDMNEVAKLMLPAPVSEPDLAVLEDLEPEDEGAVPEDESDEVIEGEVVSVGTEEPPLPVEEAIRESSDEDVDALKGEIAAALAELDDDAVPGGKIQNRVQRVMRATGVETERGQFPMNAGAITTLLNPKEETVDK